jgi:hypothetical protein
MQFGLLPPTKGADVVADQLRKALEYRRELVRVECARRDMVRAIEADFGIPALLKAEYECRLADDEKGARVARAAVTAARGQPEVQARMAEINGEKGDAALTSKERRAKKTPNNGAAAKAVRAARAASGVYWGTYLLAERAHGASCAKTPMYDAGEPNNPRCKQQQGEGQLAVQIQSTRALTGAQLFGSDTRVQIAPVDMIALTSPIRSERRKAGRTTLRMRVGHDGEIAEWPMILHRPIPEESRVSWVAVSARRVGPRLVWTCEITLEANTIPATVGNGTAAVVFGWRRHEQRIQVAQWMSPTGETGVLELTDGGLGCVEVDGGKGGVIDGLRKIHDLRAIRDRHFARAKAALVEWLRTLPEMPEWMRKRTGKRSESTPTNAQALAYLAQWRAPARLAGLARAWAKARFEGDSPNGEFDPRTRGAAGLSGFGAVEAWRYNDYHLWVWESRQRKSAERRRKNVYRMFGAQLASKFSRVLADGTDFKEVKELKPRAVEAKRGPRVKTMQQMVAPGNLRDAVKLACGSRGASFEKQNAAATALRCPKCEAKHKAHKGDDGFYACTECGFSRDIPTTRLLNMLRADGFVDEVLGIIDRGDKVLNKIKAVA